MLAVTVAVALCLLSSSTPAVQAQGIFRQMLNAPWPQRSESTTWRNPLPISVQADGGRMLIKPGAVFIYGGIDENPDPFKRGLSDVWVTTDGAKTWHLVGGAASFYGGSSVTDLKRSADCDDPRTGRVYAVTGSDGVGRTARVSASVEGIHWETITENAGFFIRERPACVVDHSSNVYMIGGATYVDNVAPVKATSDIWKSTDLGNTWQLLTLNAPFGPRISADTKSYNATMLGGIDVIYVMNGDADNGSSRLNDIWVSSDSARTWKRMTSRAPFAGRKDAELTISKDGLLLMSGGDDDKEDLSDLYVSADGGYTWGSCCSQVGNGRSCGYPPREDQMAILDGEGYYYIMAGDLPSVYGISNDVWRTTFSFHDLAAVARNCRITIPSQGVGLRCWPGDTACISGTPIPDEDNTTPSSSSSSGLSTYAIIAIVAAVLIVLGALYYFYNKKQAEARAASESSLNDSLFATTTVAPSSTS